MRIAKTLIRLDQAGLSLRRSKGYFVGFDMRRLKFKISCEISPVTEGESNIYIRQMIIRENCLRYIKYQYPKINREGIYGCVCVYA